MLALRVIIIIIIILVVIIVIRLMLALNFPNLFPKNTRRWLMPSVWILVQSMESLLCLMICYN